MPPSRPREGSAMTDDDWEHRAVAIAARLDAAADELRRLIDDIRKTQEEGTAR